MKDAIDEIIRSIQAASSPKAVAAIVGQVLTDVGAGKLTLDSKSLSQLLHATKCQFGCLGKAKSDTQLAVDRLQSTTISQIHDLGRELNLATIPGLSAS